MLLRSNSNRTTLLKQHQILLIEVEKGEGLQSARFYELTEKMRVILYHQAELKDFWKQVEKKPKESHLLHISCTDKDLLNLPWQIAIDRKKHSNVYVVKGEAGIKKPAEHKATPGPLKILVMISSPESLD